MTTERDNAIEADQRAREQALDTLASVIVQAPAGSGKTGLLTQRFLALLATVKQPEEILAITFTRKAASEMRARIIDALQRAQDDVPPESSYEKTTWELARAAQARSDRLGWHLRQNPGRLGVFTIDAFCARLASRTPVLSRAGAQPGVADNALPLYERAARALLSTLDAEEPETRNLENLILHLDNNLQRSQDLLVAMLATRDHWLPRLADPSSPRLQRDALEAALEGSIARDLERLADSLPEPLLQELSQVAAAAAEQLRLARVDSPLRPWLGHPQVPPASMAGVAGWRGLGWLLLTSTGALRKSGTKAHGFPPPSSAANADEKSRLSAHKQRFAGLLEQLAGHPVFLTRLRDTDKFPEQSYTQAQWRLLQVLMALLPRAAAELTLVFGEAGKMDFTAMAHAALRALGESDQPTDLALVLDHRIRHVLVDEFQDTSYSQATLIERLTAGWQPGDGHTLFVVGDPMQSIYRFREAEVGLFLNARAQGVGHLQLQPLTLSRNFRSQRGIVDWTNGAFASLFPGYEDAAKGAVKFAAATGVIDELPGEAVSVRGFVGASRTEEARHVLKLIREERVQRPDGSIAVLVRARSHLQEIIAVLREAGLAYRALDVEPLASQPVVQDLHALTRALLHAGDRAAWLSVLRAPWCGMTLKDLHTLASEFQSHTIWQAIIDEGRRQQLSDDGQLRLSRLKSVLAKSVAERGRRPLRRWIEGTWMALGGPVCVGADGAANADVFFRLLDELDVAGDVPSLEALEDGLSRLYASPDPSADDSLQLMTIHKAKGLEFDTVIIPGLDRAPRPGGHRLMDWLEIPESAGAGQLLLAPIQGAGETDPIQRYVRHLHAEREAFETTRLLYVAVTRARARLHLTACVRQTGDGSAIAAPRSGALLQTLWPVVHEQLESAAEVSDRLAGSGVEERLRGIRRLPPNWLLPETPQPKAWATADRMASAPDMSIEYRWASDTARHVGTVVHRTLQEVAAEGLDAWSERWLGGLQLHLERLLGVLGVPQTELREAADRATLAIRNTLADERGRWLLQDGHLDSRSEFSISGWLDDVLVTGQLDRTFIDENGIRWIVDYKTGAHEGGTVDGFLDNEMERYQEQMTRYVRLMQRLDTTPVRVGLYFPMLQGWREWEA